MISPNVIIMWVGTHASIPTGYTRATELDGKYPKGAPALSGGGTTGGAATHTHTSPTHTHTSLGTHTHTGTSSTNSHHSLHSDSDGSSTWEGDHNHTYSISTYNAQTCDSVAVTYASFSNDPPYYEVIFIKAGGYQAIPANAVLYYNDSTVPSGFTHYANLKNKYPKGAATGQNAGSSGGSTTNTHTIAHTHATTHSHTGNSNGVNSGGNTSGQYGPSSATCDNSHTHPMVLDTTNVTSASNSSIGDNAETVEPVYKKLIPIQNTGTGPRLPLKKMVAMYLGTYATVPVGWKVCDGSGGTADMRNYFVKGANTTGELGNTGGSNTHTHAAEAHNHGIGSHTHTCTAGLRPTSQNSGGSRYTTLHAVWDRTTDPAHANAGTVSSVTSTTNDANTTANSSDNQPPYVETIFIEFQYPVSGVALFAML